MSPFVVVHLSTIVPALILGPILLTRKKGDRTHRITGKIWVALMIVACLSSFGLTRGGLSWLHGLAAFTLFAVFRGLWFARTKRITRHRIAMTGAFVGTVFAFCYALLPSRLVGGFVWGLFGLTKS
jgi:uncharacterized membrane protein